MGEDAEMARAGHDQPPAAETEQPRCSARACRDPATVALRWRNPRLHDTSREKTWHACAAHDQHLADFLTRRGFLLGRSQL